MATPEPEARWPLPAHPRILITNDDGIRAPGLQVLENLARALSDDVWVVAPEEEQSGAGHSLTLRRPLRLRALGGQRFAVDGTPTDAVLLGLHKVLAERPPDLVLSGVNRGANMGEDVSYSGTVAAAMEATLLGVPAVALSQMVAPGAAVSWAPVEQHGVALLRRLLAVGWPAKVMINVNFPDTPPEQVTGLQATRQGRRKLGGDLVERVDPRGQPYIWIGPQRDESAERGGTDLDAVAAGAVSVTPLSVDFTRHDLLPTLEAALWSI